MEGEKKKSYRLVTWFEENDVLIYGDENMELEVMQVMFKRWSAP